MTRVAFLLTAFLVLSVADFVQAQAKDAPDELRLVQAENIMLVKALAAQREENAKQAEQIKRLEALCAKAGVAADDLAPAPSTQPAAKCTSCRGVKLVACTACRYNSGYATGLSRCATCRGSLKITCPDCKGAWGHACTFCNGTGRMKSGQHRTTGMIVEDSFRQCTRCNGGKEIYTCRRAPNMPGQCARLRSKGKVQCPTCDGVGNAGPCQTCQGEKKVTCPTCEQSAPATQPAAR